MAEQFTRPEHAPRASDWREVRRQWRTWEVRYEPFDNPLDAVIAAQRFLNPIPFQHFKEDMTT